MKKSLAFRLAQAVQDLSYDQLPPQVVHEVKRRLLDSLACALGAWKELPCRIAREIGSGVSQDQGAGIIGLRSKTSPDLAAFANGVMVRFLDYNDTYLSKEPCHPSDNISAALACAESFGASGQDLITAIVLAYEVVCRLCDAASLRKRGWDHVTYGPFSSALAAAKLMKLSLGQTQQAVALAGVSNVALRQTRVGELSMWKGCAFANAARNGVFAAMLARRGMTGPQEIFEGRMGFWKQVSGPFELRWFGRYKDFMILKTSLKYFPAEYHAQSAIEAALKLRPKIQRLQDIRKITIDSFEAAVSIIGHEKEKWQPVSRETADHSLPYCVAVALLDGEVSDRQFTKERIQEKTVRVLLKKIVVREKRSLTKLYPLGIPNKLTVHLAGGKQLTETVTYPKGHAKNPMTDAECERKFKDMASKTLEPEQITRLLEKVWNLERLKKVGELFEAMVVP